MSCVPSGGSASVCWLQVLCPFSESLMSSVTEPKGTCTKARGQRLTDTFEVWNRKLHYYLGLYLLFFVWLFALSGLLLNHSSWKFAEFWSNRKETTYERQITAPVPASDLVQANDLMRQLDLTGEVEWTATRNNSSRLDFRVTRPGHIFEINTDLEQKRATVKRTDLNAWGV